MNECSETQKYAIIHRFYNSKIYIFEFFMQLIQVRVEGDFEKTIGSNGAKSNKGQFDLHNRSTFVKRGKLLVDALYTFSVRSFTLFSLQINLNTDTFSRFYYRLF